ncbi:MAG TPA: glucose-1-phosphate adenylyltransferase subunit GlgD [Clostridiaceae bacterium]
MLTDYMGIINLNEDESNLKSLTHNRPLASIPVGGRYRIIDFVLSNMVNSGLRNIGIFTQSKSRSLADHLGSGKPWDLDRKINGLFLFNLGISNSYQDDTELMRKNIEYLYQSKQNNVIVSSSYMVANLNYEAAVKAHVESGRDITIIYKKIDNGTKYFVDCDALNIGDNNRVISVGKNIGIGDQNNISLEMFIMKKELLLSLIHSCVNKGLCRNLKDSIYRNVDSISVNAYEFKGYLQCINNINSYYKANMDMLEPKVNKELFFNNGLIFTKVKDEAPSKYTESCKVSNSFIANGSIIEGMVENSIISRRVIIRKGAHIRNCIIMQNCEVKSNARLAHVIIDKNVVIDSNKKLNGDTEFPLVIEKRSLF